MSQGNVTLPPIVVTPEPSLPKPMAPHPGSGVIAKPLPWDGKVVSSFEIDMFFSQKGIRTSERYTISVIVTVATAQRNIEQSYTAYLPQLPADIDAEIAAAVSIYSLTKLEQTKAAKTVVDSLIIQNHTQLAKSNAEAHAFFGRNVLAVEVKKSAVDFVNIFQSRVPGTGLGIYKSWEASATAAYRAKILAEKIRILSEKSLILAQAVATAQAEEDARLLAEAEAKRLGEEAARIAAEKASYDAAVMFLSEVNKDILVRYGENMSKVALDLQENISGKKVRSYAQAMETFEKVRINPNTKLNSQDTKAVVGALKALDQATLADNVTRLGKAFGVVGKIFQINTVREHTIVGMETGDWKPLGLELESIAVGIGAGAVLAGVMVLMMPAFVGTIAGVVTVAVLMAMAGAYFDAQKVDEINTTILDALPQR